MAGRKPISKPGKESSIRLLSCKLVSNIAYRMVVCLELLLCFPLTSILCPCATKKSSNNVKKPRTYHTTCHIKVETDKEIRKDQSTEIVHKKKILPKSISASTSRGIKDVDRTVMRSESTIVYQMRGRPRDNYDYEYGRPRGREYDDEDYGYQEPYDDPRPATPNYDPTCVDNTRLATAYDNIPPHNREPFDPSCPLPGNKYQPTEYRDYQDNSGYRSQNYEGYQEPYQDPEPPEPCEKPYDPYTPENVKIRYGPDKMKFIDRNRNMLVGSENDPRSMAISPPKTPMVRCKLSLSRTQRLSRSQRWLPGLGKLNLQQIGFPENWFGNSRIKDAYDAAKLKSKTPFKKAK